MLKTMSFSEFMHKNYKSFSHGNDYFHHEEDGLWFDKDDYEHALDAFADYEWSCFIKTIFKGKQDEKGNELARSSEFSNRSNRLSQRGKSSIRSL